MILSKNFRIYYEDTDAGGVVYYANYLKFAERGRTEFLRELGVTHQEALTKFGVLFVVKNIQMDLIKPAKLDDLIEVKTSIAELSGARLKMEQNIYLENTKICFIKVEIVVVNEKLRPVRTPEIIKDLFTKCLD